MTLSPLLRRHLDRVAAHYRAFEHPKKEENTATATPTNESVDMKKPRRKATSTGPKEGSQ